MCQIAKTFAWYLGGEKGSVKWAPILCHSSHMFGEGNGNPLQYPCLENPMDRGACRKINLSSSSLEKKLVLVGLEFTVSNPRVDFPVNKTRFCTW